MLLNKRPRTFFLLVLMVVSFVSLTGCSQPDYCPKGEWTDQFESGSINETDYYQFNAFSTAIGNDICFKEVLGDKDIEERKLFKTESKITECVREKLGECGLSKEWASKKVFCRTEGRDDMGINVSCNLGSELDHLKRMKIMCIDNRYDTGGFLENCIDAGFKESMDQSILVDKRHHAEECKRAPRDEWGDLIIPEPDNFLLSIINTNIERGAAPTPLLKSLSSEHPKNWSSEQRKEYQKKWIEHCNTSLVSLGEKPFPYSNNYQTFCNPETGFYYPTRYSHKGRNFTRNKCKYLSRGDDTRTEWNELMDKYNFKPEEYADIVISNKKIKVSMLNSCIENLKSQNSEIWEEFIKRINISYKDINLSLDPKTLQLTGVIRMDGNKGQLTNTTSFKTYSYSIKRLESTIQSSEVYRLCSIENPGLMDEQDDLESRRDIYQSWEAKVKVIIKNHEKNRCDEILKEVSLYNTEIDVVNTLKFQKCLNDETEVRVNDILKEIRKRGVGYY